MINIKSETILNFKLTSRSNRPSTQINLQNNDVQAIVISNSDFTKGDFWARWRKFWQFQMIGQPIRYNSSCLSLLCFNISIRGKICGMGLATPFNKLLTAGDDQMLAVWNMTTNRHEVRSHSLIILDLTMIMKF